MNKVDVTEAIILAKKAKDLTWEGIAEELGMGTVWVTSACLGMNSMPEEPANKLVAFLGLPEEAIKVLMEYPTKAWDKDVPQDPLIYRMSAIDFTMDVSKEENPKGDRVIINMNGKFLPYKAW